MKNLNLLIILSLIIISLTGANLSAQKKPASHAMWSFYSQEVLGERFTIPVWLAPKEYPWNLTSIMAYAAT